MSPELATLMNHTAISNLNEQEIALLRHFVVSTSTTLADNPELLRVTQEISPLLACDYQFLMDGILACSASHIAHYDSKQRKNMISTSSFYQNRGIQGFREAMLNITKENCYAVFMFSHLTVGFAFTAHMDETALSNRSLQEGVPGLFRFIRGTSLISSSALNMIENGPMKAMTTPEDKIPGLSWLTNDTIVKTLLSAIPAHEKSEHWSKKECGIYRECTMELGRAFRCCRPNNDNLNVWDAIWLWPLKIPEEYLNLLERRHPAALILLAQYCVLLVNVEFYWYMSGWGRRLLEEIYDCLDETDRAWIQRPLAETCMSP
jgi:hypothetical protein